MYQFSIAETAPVGSLVGRVKAEDSDVGENTDMTYQVKDEEGLGAFRVTTDSHSQEALLSVQKVSVSAELCRGGRGVSQQRGLSVSGWVFMGEALMGAC